jgi:dihydroorotase
VRFQGAEARARGGVNVFVAAAATIGSKGEAVTDHKALKAAGAVAVTDDGLPVLDDGVMAASLKGCAAHDLLFMQHAEDTRVTGHAPMNDSETAQRHGVRGQPSWAEAVIVERDIALAEAAGARYHVLHLSTARSLQAVKAAKARGARVSCEASPHHLLLNDADVAHGGAPDVNYKMNPPLRSEDDRAALVQGLIDGTVDAVATDHAPHHHDEKGQGFDRAPFGVTGLETALAATLSFVWNGTLSARRAVELLTSSPARVIGRAGHTGTLWGANAPADVCVVDPARVWEVTPGSILSRSKNSCFLGRFFKGRVTMTFLDGALAYQLIP